ncbi:ECF transporter S component [Nocardioides piscis]|uniref:ECF transporter S component n=1 Tax=Nocardioides piscis TaxID=2714938 RepID=A0A6G7YJV9_9ACTN|nr:ECF transporter S component [Nocardioides piscis]QIK77018.1 ECF transporter S component [Nocardioides piscis]
MDPSTDNASLDAVVLRLHAIREKAGQPSFGDIAIAVSRIRRRGGATPEQARVGRTTVYDAFRLGRRRLDADLVADIARALGCEEDTALELASRCRAAQVVSNSSLPSSEPPAVQPEEVAAASGSSSPGRRFLAVVLVGSVVINLVGRALVDTLHLPVYLDMVGTAFAAIVLGPWWGALVGVTTNLAGGVTSGAESLPFALVNVAGALVWGYGVRRWSMGRTIPRFFALNLVAALVCSAVAVPILLFMAGGFSGHGADQVTSAALALSHSLWAAVTVSNVATSASDKLIAGFVALTVIEALPGRRRAWLPDDWLRRRD